MNYNNYIDCLQAKLPGTGEFQVFYDFSSGIKNLDGDGADFLYNLKYPTGEHAKEVTIGGNQEWVVESRFLPGLSIGQTEMPITHLGYFSGVDLVQVGLGVDYSGWSAVLDISPNLCSYSSEVNLSRVLLSTMDSYDSLSGLHVGINQANKLYIQYNHEGTYSAQTVNAEISKDSIVNISQSSDSLSVGVYNLETKSLDQTAISTEEYTVSDKMYLGGFLSNTNVDYTGYEGVIKHFALFDVDYSREESVSTCQCMFSSGVDVTDLISQIVSPTITGFKDETIYITGVTGYVERYKSVADADGSSILTSYQSGVTGLIANGTNTTFLTGEMSVASNTIKSTGVLYDQDKLGLYNRYFLNFKNGLKSGELIEILSFEGPRTDVNLTLDTESKVSRENDLRLYNYGLLRQSRNDGSIMTNGQHGTGQHMHSPTEGTDWHNYDYAVLDDLTVSGFATNDYSTVYEGGGQDLMYDEVSSHSLCIDFSGHRDTHRIETGNNVYFPDNFATQFINPTNTNSEPNRDQGQVVITGVSGQAIHDRHIYYNGQKLIEDLDYFVDQIRDGNSNVWFPCVVITGGMGGFTAEYRGEWPHIFDIYTPEMCFVPKVSGEQAEETLKAITGDADGIPDPLSGFSEMIWVNGIRQKRSEGYKLGRECGLAKSFTFFGENPFIFYNNDEYYINFS